MVDEMKIKKSAALKKLWIFNIKGYSVNKITG